MLLISQVFYNSDVLIGYVLCRFVNTLMLLLYFFEKSNVVKFTSMSRLLGKGEAPLLPPPGILCTTFTVHRH